MPNVYEDFPYSFSPSDGGFSDHRITPADLLPDDAIGVSAEDYADLVKARGGGRKIAVVDAQVVAVDIDPPSLEDQRKAALARITRAAEAAKVADISWRDVTWQADARSTQALSARIASGEGATWIASDNSRRPLSRADLSALMLAITTRTEAIVLQARAKKDAILAAKTPKDIAKVDPTIDPAINPAPKPTG